jgi:hypothetical protein
MLQIVIILLLAPLFLLAPTLLLTARTALALLLHLLDSLGNLPGLLLRLLAVVSLALQCLFQPLLHLLLIEFLLFQLLNFPLFQTCLAQLLANLLFLLAKLLLLPAEFHPAKTAAGLLLHLAYFLGNLLRFPLGLLAVVSLSLQRLFKPLPDLLLLEPLLFQLLNFPLFQTCLAEFLPDLLLLLLGTHLAKLLLLALEALLFPLLHALHSPLLLLQALNLLSDLLSFPLGVLAVFAH